MCVCVCVCVCVFVCLLCCCFMRHSKRYFSSLPCFTISSMRTLRSSLLCISLAVTHCALLLLLFFPLPVCFRLHRSSLLVFFFSPITRVFLNCVASIVSQSFFSKSDCFFFYVLHDIYVPTIILIKHCPKSLAYFVYCFAKCA